MTLKIFKVLFVIDWYLLLTKEPTKEENEEFEKKFGDFFKKVAGSVRLFYSILYQLHNRGAPCP